MSSSDQTLVLSTDTWLHFVGAAGSGMSALAFYHAQQGGRCSGSDRAFDLGERSEVRRQLEAAGVHIVSQDGSFLKMRDGAFVGQKPDAVVVSTAIEDRVPDIKTAQDSGITLLHRSELLAMHVATHRTIAISGTSGKSTVTAMVFAILQAAQKDPGLLTGGALASLVNEGHLGNAWAPKAQPDGAPYLVIEADESDGSLVRYHPWVGVILNLGLDHKEPAEIMTMFTTFRANVSGPLIVADQPELTSLHDGSLLFGIDAGDGLRAENVQLNSDGSEFSIEGVSFTLQVPGLYNVQNALAAVAAARQAEVTVQDCVAPLQEFTGVARRFQSIGHANGIEVIDDFAHNPDKIEAAMAAGHLRNPKARVIAVFQPHGFGPTRFLRDALIETFAKCLNDGDQLFMPEIFFAGGTVKRDISAGDLVAAIKDCGGDAHFVPDRSDLPQAIADAAESGDVVLVMGARDPSLTVFCADILAAIKNRFSN